MFQLCLKPITFRVGYVGEVGLRPLYLSYKKGGNQNITHV